MCNCNFLYVKWSNNHYKNYTTNNKICSSPIPQDVRLKFPTCQVINQALEKNCTKNFFEFLSYCKCKIFFILGTIFFLACLITRHVQNFNHTFTNPRECICLPSRSIEELKCLIFVVQFLTVHVWSDGIQEMLVNLSFENPRFPK